MILIYNSLLYFRYTFVKDPETIIRILHTIKQYVLQHGCYTTFKLIVYFNHISKL